MKNFQKVYILWQNRDDGLPLFIENQHQNINWVEFDEYLNTVKPIQDYVIANFIVKKPKEMLCDYYHGSGLGVVSNRLLQLTNVFDDFKKFTVQVNGEDFSMLIPEKITDCFDVTNSVWVKYDEASTMMASIAEYTFFDDKVPIDKIFSIPEINYRFCTDIVKTELEKKAYLGFYFMDVYDVDTGRVSINVKR